MSKERTIASKPTEHDANATLLAKSLAPEGIREGMHVMVLSETVECLRWSDGFDPSVSKTLIEVSPCNGQRPAKVVGVCLPYVLVETGQGEPYCYDVRNVRLARVSHTLADSVRAIDRAREKKLKKKKQSTKGKSCRKPRAKRKRGR